MIKKAIAGKGERFLNDMPSCESERAAA